MLVAVQHRAARSRFRQRPDTEQRRHRQAVCPFLRVFCSSSGSFSRSYKGSVCRSVCGSGLGSDNSLGGFIILNRIDVKKEVGRTGKRRNLFEVNKTCSQMGHQPL